ncbi:hypothetical protein O181_092190, partial [Austropuccinia psidii MF-1]|nr:hypothetical protein [Austropuccinia psidii MF-1]
GIGPFAPAPAHANAHATAPAHANAHATAPAPANAHASTPAHANSHANAHAPTHAHASTPAYANAQASTPAPAVPINPKFKKTPKQVPVDFYPPKWFKNLDHAQRFSIANNRKVAFIPTNDISMSKPLNPDENLCDKAFNKKFWHVVTEPYDLSHEVVESSEDDDDKDDSAINELSDGDIIDLHSLEEDESDDGNLEDTKENQDSQVRWTPDVDDEMVEDFFEEGFNPHVQTLDDVALPIGATIGDSEDSVSSLKELEIKGTSKEAQACDLRGVIKIIDQTLRIPNKDLNLSMIMGRICLMKRVFCTLAGDADLSALSHRTA